MRIRDGFLSFDVASKINASFVPKMESRNESDPVQQLLLILPRKGFTAD